MASGRFQSKKSNLEDLSLAERLQLEEFGITLVDESSPALPGPSSFVAPLDPHEENEKDLDGAPRPDKEEREFCQHPPPLSPPQQPAKFVGTTEAKSLPDHKKSNNDERLEQLLSKRKEGDSWFFLSTEDCGPFADLMQPLLGLYRMPTPAYYGGTFPQGDLMLVFHCSNLSDVNLSFPPHVQDMLVREGIVLYDFFWVVSNVHHIITKFNTDAINMVHHAWAFPEIPFTLEKIRMAHNFPMGIFSYPGSHVAPTPKRSIAFQCLQAIRVSVHSQKGGMCCSPNNGRFQLVFDPSFPISWFWTVCIDPFSPMKRACVSLQWVLHQEIPQLSKILQEETTLNGVIDKVTAFFGPHAPHVHSMHCLFGRAPMDSHPEPENPPFCDENEIKLSQRDAENEPCADIDQPAGTSKKRGQHSGGGSRGGKGRGGGDPQQSTQRKGKKKGPNPSQTGPSSSSSSNQSANNNHNNSSINPNNSNNTQ